MENGNVQEFVDHIHYGDELWFASVDKGIQNKTTKYGLPTY